MAVAKFIIKNPTYTPVKRKKPLKVRPQDITLQPLLASDLGRTYIVSFIINGPTGRVNKKSFRDAIISNISSYDRTYMELKTFTRRKASFHLRTKKYMDDTLRNVRPRTVLTSFSRKYKLKKRIPDMITTEILSKRNFNDFLLRHFKEFINNNRNKRDITKFFNIKTRRRISNLFDYDYDSMWNVVTIKLKALLRSGLLFATSRSLSNRTFTPVNFNRSVNRNLSSFNRGKWRRRVGRKFI